MRTIYKYTLNLIDEQIIQLTRDAYPLCVQTQGGVPMLWVLCDPEDSEHIDWEITTRGTGHSVPNHIKPTDYVGTYQLDGGHLIFHVFAQMKG